MPAEGTAAPAVRPLRTFLKVIWERQGRWIVRARGDYAWRRVAWVAAFVAIVTALVTAGASLQEMLAPTVIIGAFFAVLFVLTTGSGPSTTIDWRNRHVVREDEAFPLADLRGVALSSGLIQRRGHRGISRYQAWSIDLLRSSGPVVRIAVHAWEYTLLGAARHLAVQLAVPLYDACGGPRSVTAWNPRGHSPGSAVIAYRKEDDSLGAPEEADERTTGRGVEISWRRNLKRQVNIFFAALLLLALGAPLLVRFAAVISVGGWVAVGMAALVPVTFVVALPGTLRFHGVNVVTVTSDAVLVRTSWPVALTNRIPRAAIEWVRLSMRMSTPPARVPQVCLDFVASDGRLLRRFRLPEQDARWLAERIRRALGAEVIDKKWEGWGEGEDGGEHEDEHEDEGG